MRVKLSKCKFIGEVRKRQSIKCNIIGSEDLVRAIRDGIDVGYKVIRRNLLFFFLTGVAEPMVALSMVPPRDLNLPRATFFRNCWEWSVLPRLQQH